jgi:hypothetical protein
MSEHWTDEEMDRREAMAHEVHIVYCMQYMLNEGKPYWTNGDYSRLENKVKDFDRALVAWHLTKVEALTHERDDTRSRLLAANAALAASEQSLRESREQVARMMEAKHPAEAAIICLIHNGQTRDAIGRGHVALGLLADFPTPASLAGEEQR